MKLFEPLKIGDITIKNRVVMSPMITNLATPEGYPSEEHISYFLRRKSVGLMITEYTYVNKVDSRGSPNQLGLYDDALIPKFARLTEAVHNVGSKIFVQLVHVGRKTRRNLIWGNDVIAPSNIPLIDPVKEMTENDINRVVDDFVKASERAEKSGFDGIELHGAHGYLIAQFLSPATNKRVDKYKDGVLFLEEIIKEIRTVTSIPVGLRISATEFDPGGLTPEIVGKIISRVEDKLDYVHLSAGRDGPLGGSSSFYYKKPSYLEEAKVVKNYVKRIPMLLVGSVTTLEEANKVLEIADAVVLGRQILADPDWLEKIRNKEEGPIRPCIRCNQSCRLLSTREVRCDVNPELGWEILPPMERGEGSVTVVGGGLAGMEASRVLALRGFEVELYEKSDKLGGELNEYRDPYKRKEFSNILTYYEQELKRLGVKIRLSAKTEKADLLMIPSESQPSFVEYKGLRILVNSNLYAYQDYVFEWVKSNEVYVTDNVFKGLDRNRAFLLKEIYKGLGVRFEKPEKVDVTINDVRKEQPSIGKAIAKGYWAGRMYKNRYS
ncbi:NAD(P)-binding protein [Stygiolobus caldivivus]|uniref:NADH oxidase n=1 Tax=Stygiolobus caldivivus TaxID=2824673 RepID=A0A8D5ZJE2_9CREN|nr:NAD(P)-binding protein [Stygiolobus caldivivus]BCU71489.1 NADH oxidase [Stygiolobus caldivivus]